MLILLDRDGVINEDTAEGITRPDQLRLIKGACEAIARLTSAGWQVAIITNQSVVGKGLVSEEELEAIHKHMRVLLRDEGAHIDAIYWCGDHPDEATDRRKPGPGMLHEALRDFGGDAVNTPMVGDALRDLQAAKAAGCQPHLVRTGKGEQTARDSALSSLGPVQIHDDLNAFATYWLREGGAGPKQKA